MATEREIDLVVEDLDNKNMSEGVFLYTIVQAASRYWEGITGDFCLQRHMGETIVFGSTNRLIYSPFTGFTADRSHCSEKFLASYDRLGPLPGRK